MDLTNEQSKALGLIRVQNGATGYDGPTRPAHCLVNTTTAHELVALGLVTETKHEDGAPLFLPRLVKD